MSKAKFFIDETLQVISTFGSYQFFILLALYFAVAQRFYLSSFLLVGFFIMCLLVIPTRLVFYKERPKKKKHEGILEKIDASGMPSMHAAIIAFLLQFAIFFINGAMYVTMFFVFITILVLYSRTYLQEHKTLDVVVGFFIGLFVFIAMLLTQTYLF